MRKEPFLYASSFVMDGCFALVGLCVPLLAMQLGGTYGDLGGLRATGSLAYSLGCLLSGRLSDRIGYRRSLTWSSLLVLLSFFCYPHASSVTHLFVLSAVTGVAIAGFWPPMQAWLGAGKDRRSLLVALGRFNVAWSLGFIVGPALGGSIYEIGPRPAFLLAGGLVGVLFLFLVGSSVTESEATPREEVQPPATTPSSGAFLPVAWTANFSTFFAMGAVRSLFPKLATDLGIPPSSLGHLMSLVGLAQLTSFYVVSRTERWQFRLGPLLAVQAVAAVGLSTLAFGGTPAVFALGLLSQGALTGMTFTSSIFYSLHAEGPGGRRTGFHEFIVGSGFLFGPLAGGFVAEHLGARSPYLLAVCVIVAAMAAQWATVSRHARRRATLPRARS